MQGDELLQRSLTLLFGATPAGSQVILFGNAEDAKEKLENLKTFYQKVMSQMDWHVYKSINLKYKNQVVCSKYLNYE